MNDLANVNMQDGTELMKQPSQPTQSMGAVQEQSKAIAAVQAAYVMALNRPRNENRALDRIKEMCTRTSLAEKAEYCFPRGNGVVRGPSSDLIRQIARHWMNIETGIDELSRHDGVSEVLAYAVDLECNYRVEKKFTVKHRRDTKKGGYQLTDERDIYELVANMGARRQRACLEAVIPADIIEEAVNACRRTLEKHPIQERIAGMVAAFKNLGVEPRMIEARAGKYLREFTHSEVTEYIAIGRAIKNGEMRLQVVFPDAGVKAPSNPDKANAGQKQGQGRKKGKASKKTAQSDKEPAHTPAKTKSQPQQGEQVPQDSARADQTASSPAPQEDGDIWAEVQARAVELWGDDAKAQLEAVCEQFGMNFKKLSAEDAESLLDVLNERLSMQG